jgi:hypothetical protein
VTLPQKPRDGHLQLVLTLPTTSTQDFDITGAAIVSGPKAAPPPAPLPAAMPAAMPAVMPAPVVQQPQMPIAMALPMQSVVQSALSQARVASEAAAAVERPVVMAQAVLAPTKPTRKRKRSQARAGTPKPAPRQKTASKTPVAPKSRAKAKKAAPKRRPPPPPRQPSVVNRRGRAITAPQKYGDRGEMDGAARNFQSTPVPSKPMPSLEIERGVPAYALPGGGQIFCMGLHAGVRKKFRARVVSLRRTFPRIVVRYEATEDGSGTSRLELPELQTAYVTMADIEEIRN